MSATGCGRQAPAVSSEAAPIAPVIAASEEAAPIAPVIAASELVVGLNRLPFGLLQGGVPLNDPNLRLDIKLYYVGAGGDRSTPVAETQAIYRGQGLPVGLYVAYANLDRAGGWEAEIAVPQAGGSQISRIRLDVSERAFAPKVGDKAIPSRNLTAADVPSLDRLTSDPRPDPDFYRMTIADALASGKPLVVSFATPGYCQTAVCSPNMAVLKQLKSEFGDRVNFIHVEVYPYPFGESFQQAKLVPAMQEWNLRTEPWTFLIDSNGIIQARYEGGITFDELRPAIAQLAAGQPVNPMP
ncbi:MAG: thioredoxin fold domain-containing protein [Chloroflexus sp.]